MDTVYVEGKTYDFKEEIKAIKRSNARVFSWDSTTKSWRAKVHDHEIDGLAAEVAEKCPGCSLRTVV